MKRIFAIAFLVLCPALLFSQAGSRITIGGPIAPDGKTEVACDLPVSQRTLNRGGSDGAGLCVFSSIGHSARWQNDEGLKDFQKFMWTRPGGGTPQKVDRMVRLCAPSTRYIQYEGRDMTILKMALATGRMPSVTYGPAHMTNLIHLDDQWAAVLDNNYVGEREIRWMSPQEFYRLWTANGAGWAVILLSPPPPPPPTN